MKKNILISSLLCIAVISILFSNQAYAERLSTVWQAQSTLKVVTVNKVSYSLNTCDNKDISALRVKVWMSVRNADIKTKRRAFLQLRLLQASRYRECSAITQNTQQVGSTQWFAIITNPWFIASLSEADKAVAEERSRKYLDISEKVVNDMIWRRILNVEDKKMLSGKIRINYVLDCKKIDGLTSVKQWYDENNILAKSELLYINLNVSICNEKNFNALFEKSYRHVYIHELGHYVYFMKDLNTQNFEQICRYWTTKNELCQSNEAFFSVYSAGEPQEDYAEAFAFWYQWKDSETTKGDNIQYLGILNQKKQHFSSLFAK